MLVPWKAANLQVLHGVFRFLNRDDPCAFAVNAEVFVLAPAFSFISIYSLIFLLLASFTFHPAAFDLLFCLSATLSDSFALLPLLSFF